MDLYGNTDSVTKMEYAEYIKAMKAWDFMLSQLTMRGSSLRAESFNLKSYNLVHS